MPGHAEQWQRRTKLCGAQTSGPHSVGGNGIGSDPKLGGIEQDAVGASRHRTAATPAHGPGRDWGELRGAATTMLVPECGDGAVGSSRHTPASTRTALIIELFGPAAAGKTTLARALGTALVARGIAVWVVSSARPAEQRRHERESLPQPRSRLMAPLARASKIFSALGTVDRLVRQLVAVLPPGNWIRTLRARRYLTQLCQTWDAARGSDEVVIFDQGFLTSLCSLALLSGRIDRTALAHGLTLIPQPDLLVRIDTPREVLEARLQKRLRRQGALERLFENDIDVSLHQIDLSSTLDALLTERGHHSMRVSWIDRTGLASVVDAITLEVVSRRGGALS
jgi:thymidylate kinase